MHLKNFKRSFLPLTAATLMLATGACHNAQKLPEGYAQADYFGHTQLRGTAPGTPPRGVNIAGVRDSEPEYLEETVDQ